MQKRYMLLSTLIAALLLSSCTGTGEPADSTTTASTPQPDVTTTFIPETSGPATSATDENPPVSDGDPTAVEGLAYEISESGDFYTVTGIGSVTDTDIVIPESYKGLPVTVIGHRAFADSRIQSVTIPNSVTTIEAFAFSLCRSLTDVRFGGGETVIGDAAFIGCTGLTHVALPDGVTRIGDNAFNSCSSLETVSVPDSVREIGADAFNLCGSLKEIYYSGTSEEWGKVEIGDGNFGDAVYYYGSYNDGSLIYTRSGDDYVVAGPCPKADPDVVIPESCYGHPIVEIASGAFSNCPITSVTIPRSVRTISPVAFVDCGKLEKIAVSEENPYYHAVGNCLIETESGTLVTVVRNFVIPTDGSVTQIGNYVFFNCDFVVNLVIPEGVTGIGAAFSYCPNMTSVTIPASVTEIDRYVFMSCDVLRDIYFGGTKEQWEILRAKIATLPDEVTVHYNAAG